MCKKNKADSIRELHGLVETLAGAYRSYLPCPIQAREETFHSANSKLPPSIRTRLAFIEDCVRKADELTREDA